MMTFDTGDTFMALCRRLNHATYQRLRGNIPRAASAVRVETENARDWLKVNDACAKAGIGRGKLSKMVEVGVISLRRDPAAMGKKKLQVNIVTLRAVLKEYERDKTDNADKLVTIGADGWGPARAIEMKTGILESSMFLWGRRGDIARRESTFRCRGHKAWLYSLDEVVAYAASINYMAKRRKYVRQEIE